MTKDNLQNHYKGRKCSIDATFLELFEPKSSVSMLKQGWKEAQNREAHGLWLPFKLTTNFFML